LIEGASETDSTCAVRDTAQGSQNRTIAGAVKALFRDAVQALLGRDHAEDEPQPEGRGKKDGERDSGMMQFARRFARRLETTAQRAANMEMRDDFREVRAEVTHPAEAEDIFEAPGAYLSDPHDCASPFFSTDAVFAGGFDDSFVPTEDYYSPHL
jgi:hypothetical protein